MDYTTPGDYAAQTTKWRDYFGISNSEQYNSQVKTANQEIERLRTSNPDKYNEFMSNARAWGAREDVRIAEYDEKNAPFTPLNSGKYHENGEYIVLSMSTADGVLEVAMEQAYKSGDINVGYIISAYSNTKWRYEIKCVNYDANGLTPSSFLKGVTKGKTIQSNVNSEIVANLSMNELPYRKKGTCNIRLEYVGDTNVKASDSPQYNDGKERVSVHYTL
ncbi:hypothetical protein [Nostoc sp.]|uniref:hypothetical protein n=1 Tax=Nostoc sp. TaxID=1180 RepID=UPI002FF9213A